MEVCPYCTPTKTLFSLRYEEPIPSKSMSLSVLFVCNEGLFVLEAGALEEKERRVDESLSTVIMVKQASISITIYFNRAALREMYSKS